VPMKSSQNTVPPSVRFKIEERHRIMYCDVPKVNNSTLIISAFISLFINHLYVVILIY
jgi:hypothetical protein